MDLRGHRCLHWILSIYKCKPQMRQHLRETQGRPHPQLYCVAHKLPHKRTSQLLRIYVASRWALIVNLSVCFSSGTNPASFLRVICPDSQRDYFPVSVTWFSSFHSISPVYNLLILASFAPGFGRAGLLSLSAVESTHITFSRSMFTFLTWMYPRDLINHLAISLHFALPKENSPF